MFDGGGGDAGAIVDGVAEVVELGLGLVTEAVEEAGGGGGSGEEPEGGIIGGGGEGGTKGGIDVVGDAGGFVDDEERSGVAAGGGGGVGESENAGSVVGEEESGTVAAVVFEGDLEGGEMGGAFVDEFGGLFFGGGSD